MIAGAGVVAGALVAAYPLFWRARCLTWGATTAEADQRLPGDELLPAAQLVTTRAIGIDAPAEAVWPWLVQMGSGRAGAYSYDWIENLFGLDMHSANVILPQFQDLKAGDELPMGKGLRRCGWSGSTPAMCSRYGSTAETGCGSSHCSRRMAVPAC